MWQWRVTVTMTLFNHFQNAEKALKPIKTMSTDAQALLLPTAHTQTLTRRLADSQEVVHVLVRLMN